MAFIFDRIFFILAGYEDNHKVSTAFQFRPDPTTDCELTALEHLIKFPQTSNGRNVVTTLAPSIFNGSSLFLQVTRTIMQAWMNLNCRQIRLLISELAALECLNNCISTFSRVLLIRSLLKLQITKECILSWIYSNVGQIGPQTTELVALE